MDTILSDVSAPPAAAKPAPDGKEIEKRLRLTQQEKRIVDYHRKNIETGNVGSDPEGRPVTVYSTGIRIPGGKNEGKFVRSEEHTSELQSLMRISYAVFCLKKKNIKNT